jgi:hypothetical protein
VNGHDEAISQLVRIIAALVARTGSDQAVFPREELAAVPEGVQVVVGQPGLIGFPFPVDDNVIVKLLGMPPTAPAAPVRTPPKPDPADRLPRGRNPRIGCEHVDGTWIHGRPHDCPKSARGFR